MTLLADSENKMIQAFETKCLKTFLRISYLEHMTNDWVRSKINFLEDSQEPLLATVRRRNWHSLDLSHAMTASPKSILQGTLGGGRRRRRQRK